VVWRCHGCTDKLLGCVFSACLKAGGKGSGVSQLVKSCALIMCCLIFSRDTCFFGAVQICFYIFFSEAFLKREGEEAKGCSLTFSTVLTQAGFKRCFSYVRLSWVGPLLLE